MTDVAREDYPFPQPNSDHCFVCGRNNPRGLYIKFFDNGGDEVYAEPCLGVEWQGYPGIVHGGVSAAILDEAVGRVAMIGDHHHFMMSVKMDVKYRLPVPIDTPLRVLAKAVRLRGRLGTAQGRLFLPDGRVAVEAALLLADLPEKAMIVKPADFGWRIDR